MLQLSPLDRKNDLLFPPCSNFIHLLKLLLFSNISQTRFFKINTVFSSLYPLLSVYYFSQIEIYNTKTKQKKKLKKVFNTFLLHLINVSYYLALGAYYFAKVAPWQSKISIPALRVSERNQAYLAALKST